MMERNDIFLRKEYEKALFPIMFSVLGGTINALIDSAFVSQSIGSKALAAVNMSMPVYLVLCVIGVLLSGGASLLSAQAAGKENMERACRIYHTAILWYVIFGVLLTVAGVFCASPVSYAMSQGGELYPYVYDYTFITLLGTIPTIMVYLPLDYLQLEGKNRDISIMMGIMVGTDILFDYLFLFVFSFGIRGAAIASVVSTLLACAYGFFALERGFSNYHFHIKQLSFYETWKIFQMGSPLAVGNLVDALKLLLLNGVILKALGAPGAAVWAVINSLSELSMTISSGVPQTASPMIGVYFPSKENNAIRTLMRLQLVWGMILMGIYSAVILILHQPIAMLFDVKESLLLPILCLAVYLLIDLVCSIWISELRATNQLILSNIMNFFRKFAMPVLAAIIIYLKEWYLWLFLPVGAVLSVLIGWLFVALVRIRATRKTGYPLSGILLLDDHLTREHLVLDFSIEPNVEAVCDAAERISEFCEINQMDKKLLMRLSLAIEEFLTLLVQKSHDLKSVDLRAFVLEDSTGIQVRYSGEKYNPFEGDEEDEELLMGVQMLEKLSEIVTHYYSLGFNTIHIFFER